LQGIAPKKIKATKIGKSPVNAGAIKRKSISQSAALAARVYIVSIYILNSD